jgi:hypothetical protein
MKLADEALIRIIEIFRQGLMDNKDVSVLLRELDLERNASGKLTVSAADVADWTVPEAPETD